VSDFRLDKFEVTVARMRAFRAAYPGSRPAASAGAHPNLATSGWNTNWNTQLPGGQAGLSNDLGCPGATWTNNAGANEQKPINCVDWYLAFAFCAWDGGWLPTEAEWNYAAAGGSEQRIYAWSGSTVDPTYAVYNNNVEIGVVASKSPKGDGRWGHADLIGNVAEWVLDWYTPGYLKPCTDCAQLAPQADRIRRGGSFGSFTNTNANTTARANTPEQDRSEYNGIRCARAK
jgi:formylglycine-generating enzyme required for sulfatase activity